MTYYVLVDDRDGRILAEFASAAQAMRWLGRRARDSRESPPVSLVQVDEQHGALAGTTSMVSVRPLSST